jgi:hypothetical protein
LEGLEVSVLNFIEYKTDNDFSRLDSEYFNKENLSFEKKIKSANFDTLENITQIISGQTPQYDLDGSIPVIRSGELNYKWLDETCLLKVNISKDLFYLNKRDIMISSIGFGSIGKVDIFFKDDKYATVSEVTILRNSKLNPYYLAEYLTTKYGQSFINKYITGATGQLHLNKSSIKNILVPLYSSSFQDKIEILITTAFSNMELSRTLYSQAENLLTNAIGLNSDRLNAEAFNVKNFKNSFITTGRLDAEYYQKKYDELENQIMLTGAGVRLGTLLKMNKRGSQPTYIVDANGLPVLNSKHIRKNKIDFSDNRTGDINETNAELIIRKNDVLINGTGVGTIGRCAVYMREQPALPDNHVTILRTNAIDPVFLAVMLNSPIGKMQVDKYFKGSSGQIELYPADINEFVVWNAPKDLQKKIRASIEEAESLNQQSEHLLEVAKKALEMAIEEGEERAMERISNQVDDKLL